MLLFTLGGLYDSYGAVYLPANRVYAPIGDRLRNILGKAMTWKTSWCLEHTWQQAVQHRNNSPKLEMSPGDCITVAPKTNDKPCKK